MRFTQEMIKAIVENQKSQTRRLVKPGEIFNTEPGKGPVNAVVNTISQRLRYSIGQDYAVQDESGKAIWWCPECFNFTALKDHTCDACFEEKCDKEEPRFNDHFKYPLESLRIRIEKIWQEWLLNITEENAKAESFKSKREFLLYFYTLYKDREEVRSQWPFNFKIDDSDKNLWNPLVWAISFKKVVE